MKHLWEELINYSRSDYYPFHMPGHKRFPKDDELACRMCRPKEEACMGGDFAPVMRDICKCDITEIEGFDNLHDARDLLLGLQQKAADVYHAEQSFFLVNGSTGGILSAVSAAAEEGMKLLVARNSHRSVYNGLLLNRLQAEYLWPQMTEGFDIQGEITAEQVGRYLAGREDICGVAITSPTYDGIISDVRGIAEEVHAFGIPLIVDEAHGAHFALSREAPESAVECGADIVINSVHKTLPALTQTALLHVQGKLIDRDRLRRYLGIYQSSSPSYLLMASIDQCIDYIAGQGKEEYRKLLKLRKQIEERAAALSRIRIMPFGEKRDPGKLVISVKGTGMSGQDLYGILLKQYHLQMEMAAPSYVLGILTAMDSEEGVERLMSALEETDRRLLRRGGAAVRKNRETDEIYNMIPAPSGLSIYEAMQYKKEWLFPEEAAGRISGGFLCFYPPGIPFIVPGEIIGEELVSRIREISGSGEYITGISEEGKVCVCS